MLKGYMIIYGDGKTTDFKGGKACPPGGINRQMGAAWHLHFRVLGGGY